MSEALDRLWRALEGGSSWRGTAGVLAAFIVLGLMRRFLDPEARSRTHLPAWFLITALVFRTCAWLMSGTASGGGAASVFGLLAVLCLVMGLVGLAGLVVFDLILRRYPMPSVLRDFAQAIVVALIVVGTLYQYGFDPISLAATGGVVTAIVGFALQGTIANVFAGLALPLEGEFAIGDWIDVGGHVGRIREIKWRSTTIVTKDGDTVVIPNNQLITSSVTNYSRPTAAHRMRIDLTFHDRHPPNQVRAVVLDAVRGVPGVLAQPVPDLFVKAFADTGGVAYALRVWIDDFLRSDPIVGEVRARIWYAARRAGLEMPLPSQALVMEQPTAATAESAGRLQALDRVDLFTPLDAESRERVARGLVEQEFCAGEDIIRQDDPGDSLFIIDRGLVDVRVTGNGVHRSIAQLGPGQFFGEMSLMMGAPRQATVTAVHDTICYVLDQSAFRCVLDTRPSVMEDISTILAERQTGLAAGRDGLSIEARARAASETRSKLLAAIRRAFAI
jgi:small-conductance mechanosensitive channel/CRP-like cAMP-binding protein